MAVEENNGRRQEGRRVWSTMLKQAAAASLFGVSSILIMTVNKSVLTTYNFSAFQVVGLGQILAIIVILRTLKACGVVSFPDCSWQQFNRVYPLPLFYFLNLVFGLGATLKTNLPMFTVLRRFTLILVAAGQMYMFKQYESAAVNGTLVMMIAGALVAAYRDLSFDLVGYLYVTLNNVVTAVNTLYVKKKLNGDMSNVELMYYNCLFTLVPAVAFAAGTGDLSMAYQYTRWAEPGFLLNFGLSCVMGAILMYSMTLCQSVVSALTHTVIGCIKNIAVTYVGMYVGGDYVYEKYNFIGIHISIVASVLYSVFKLREQEARQLPQPLCSPAKS
ncbi:hypothetical protein EMCRGX_G022691 [Ephydatia muelleri]|eukprot:Em0017g935a